MKAFDGRLDRQMQAQMAAAGLKYGIAIGRRAPLHKMHVDCIREIAAAGLTPVIIIGSVNGVGDPLYDPLRNPLTPDQQKTQLARALPPELYQKCRILSLRDEPDDAVWMRNLLKLLEDNGMAGRAVMHFRAKAADAATADAARCRPLSQYKKDLLDAGVAVWQSYNANPADDDICASDIRRYNLDFLTQGQKTAAPTAEAMRGEIFRLRERANPDGRLLDAARIPSTMLDYTLQRLFEEAGIRSRDIMAAAAALGGGISLATMLAATAEKVEELKRRPLIVAGPGVDSVSRETYAKDARFVAVPASVGTFQSGETFSEFFHGEEADFEKNAARLKGAHVFIVQSTASPVGNNVQHLLHMIHTAKFYGAARVTVALPFAAYARQDRAFDRRFASVGADMLPRQLKAAGADAVICVTLHSRAAMDFYKAAFGSGFTPLSTTDLFVAHLKNIGLYPAEGDVMVGAPDGGEKLQDEGIARAADVAKAFSRAGMFRISKTHTAASDTKVTAFSGDVKNKTAVLVDDMVDGGSTLINAARVLKENGAGQVICCVTHGVLTAGRDGPALEKLLSAEAGGKPLIDRFVVTDSVPDVREKFNALAARRPDLAAKVDILPLAPLLADTMQQSRYPGMKPKAA
jgi:ribose-phosphate pyrophosphokinase